MIFNSSVCNVNCQGRGLTPAERSALAAHHHAMTHFKFDRRLAHFAKAVAIYA